MPPLVNIYRLENVPRLVNVSPQLDLILLTYSTLLNFQNHTIKMT